MMVAYLFVVILIVAVKTNSYEEIVIDFLINTNLISSHLISVP